MALTKCIIVHFHIKGHKSNVYKIITLCAINMRMQDGRHEMLDSNLRYCQACNRIELACQTVTQYADEMSTDQLGSFCIN